jgi:acyl carrier protein
MEELTSELKKKCSAEMLTVDNIPKLEAAVKYLEEEKNRVRTRQ